MGRELAAGAAIAAAIILGAIAIDFRRIRNRKRRGGYVDIPPSPRRSRR